MVMQGLMSSDVGLTEQDQHTRELISARNTSHNYNNEDLSRLR